MSDPKPFNCPSCGASLTAPAGDAKEINCTYCGTTVIVPRELRNRTPRPRQSEANDSKDFLKQIMPVIGFSLDDTNKGMLALAGGVVVLFLCVIFISLQFNNRSSAAAPTLPAQFLTLMDTAAAVKQGSTASKTPQAALVFGGEGTAPGLFQKARHVAVDANGNIYASDDNTFRIQRFDATGKYVSGWIVTDPEAVKFKYSIDAVAADRAGAVYVTLNQVIYKYDGVTGNLLDKYTGHIYWSAVPLAEGGIIATASSNASEDDLVKLDANGKEVWYRHGVISSQPGGKAPFRLAIAVDGLGNIFALQNDEGAIYKYTPDGKFVTKFGSKGGQAGQFNSDGLYHIAVDNQSNVYVNDWEELYIFDINGRYIKMFDAFSSIGGTPDDMIIDDKNELFAVNKNKIYKLVLSTP